MTFVGVTGASGFLGTVLLGELTRRGHTVRALTRTLGSRVDSAAPDVEWIAGDLASPKDAEAFISGLDAVVHLAWTNTPLTSNVHLPSDAAVNVLPTLNLIEAIRGETATPHVVFASSGGAVYGAAESGRRFREEDVCRPESSYGIQKLAVEQYLRMAADLGWLTSTVLRIGNPYGVLLPPERRQGFIGTALAQLRSGSEVRVFGSLSNVRDYVHLDDVADAFERALAFRTDFRTFNIGSGVGVSVRELLDLFEEVHGRAVPTRIEETEDAAHLPSWVVLDVARAAEELGWAPTVDLRTGLERLFAEIGR